MRSKTLFSKLLAMNLLVTLAGILFLGITLDRLLERRAISALEDRLAAQAESTAAAVTSDPSEIQDLVVRLGRASGTRLTVIRKDGVVMADSEHDPAAMQNHGNRPEVRAALAGSLGTNERVSETLGKPFLYVAIPQRGGLIFRAALPKEAVVQQRSDVRRIVALASGLMALAVIIVSAGAARTLARPLENLAEEIVVSEGSPPSVTPRGPQEVRVVAKAVNRMRDELALSIESLRDETSLREGILTSMHEGVILTGQHGELVYANPAAARLFGRERLNSLPVQLLQEEAEFTVHHPWKREISSSRVDLEDGRTLFVLSDVTEARRVEAIRRDFVANASHELKTPIAAILATAETIASAAASDPASMPNFSSKLVAESVKLSRLVEDLLDLARLEQEDHSLGFVQLAEVVRLEIKAFEPQIENKGLELALELDESLEVQGVPKDLALLVRNLLENAVINTTSGRIEIRLSSNDGQAALTVSDTGVGIPTVHLERIFERFYRVDEARSRETGGTGLGLAIVRHVALAHNGTVSVSSELGRGSSFIVTIPLK